MIPLLLSGSDIKVAKYLIENPGKFRLVAMPELVTKIYYEGRRRGENPRLDFINPLSMDELNTVNNKTAEQKDTRAFIVADATGEARRVGQLRAAYPNVTFYGLMEDFLPAFMARQLNRIGELDQLDLDAALDIVLLFAPPRSGSSLVADVLVDFGVGNTAEHLRDTLIECMSADYACDWDKMLRRFLHLSANNGWVGSKIISHFLSDYFAGPFKQSLIARLTVDGHRVHPIFLYRRNVVLQTVSGYLASKRGVWHMIEGQREDLFQKDDKISYDFNRLFSRYVSYSNQIRSLQMLEEIFPEHLRLVYEEDCEDVDALSEKISQYLKLPKPAQLSRSQTRKKIANELNEEFETRFRKEYRSLFGTDPH